MDPRVFPSLAPLLGSLAAVTAVVEGALERAGGASTQVRALRVPCAPEAR